MEIVPVIHQANRLGLRVRVNPENNEVKFIGQRTPEAEELLAELTRRKPEIVQCYLLWSRLQELLAKECLWMEESRELLHLAARFGVRVDIQRTILGSIYDESFGRTLKVSHVSNLETINTPIGDDQMAKVSEIYESAWLKAEDLKGKAYTMRIQETAVSEFKNQDGTKERKIVISFAGAKKKLICNKGQASTLVKLFGDDTDHWNGKEVVLSAIPTNNGKEGIAITGVPMAEPAGDDPF